MGVFEMVVVIVVVGGITTVASKYLEHNKGMDLDKLMEMGLGVDEDGNSISLNRIEQLEERVAVLEKIVTDRRYDLKEEIDRL